MKYIYINSRLRVLSLSISAARPNQWLFSGGEPWLLLTPRRMGALERRLGMEDGRMAGLLRTIRRWHPHPEAFCRLLGVEESVQLRPEEYPAVLCPRCDSVHTPHPMEADEPCRRCFEAAGGGSEPGPGVLEDLRLDRQARAWVLENDPGAFDEGRLSPNWRINKTRRLERDWDAAINRILLGMPYRRVAKEYNCSVGLLHRKVHERRHWEDN